MRAGIGSGNDWLTNGECHLHVDRLGGRDRKWIIGKRMWRTPSASSIADLSAVIVDQ